MTGQIPRNGWSRHFGMSDQHARNLQIDEETEDLDDQQNDPDSGSPSD